jgi:hypothetical protein
VEHLPGAEMRRRGDVTLLEIRDAVDVARLCSIPDIPLLGPPEIEVLASVVTESDNGGIDLPPHVLELVRRTHCGLGLSFSSVGPEDDG